MIIDGLLDFFEGDEGVVLLRHAKSMRCEVLHQNASHLESISFAVSRTRLGEGVFIIIVERFGDDEGEVRN